MQISQIVISSKELQAHPYIQLCVCDQETMTYVRLGGKVNFTSDQVIIDRCFENSRHGFLVNLYDEWQEGERYVAECVTRHLKKTENNRSRS